MIKLFIKEIEDEYSRENFLNINNENINNIFNKAKFRFIEITVSAAESNKKVLHGLNFQPLDVIQLSVRENDTTNVTWHYDSFDREAIYITTDGPCIIRAYLGRYGES